MPAKNVVRNFVEGGYYHIYNRGFSKQEIFLDEEDYKIFLYYLYIYIAPLDTVLKRHPNLPIRLRNKNLHGEIELLAYCLMPNHFHLLVKQETKDAIPRLMKQLTNAYTLYFNEKYKRTGALMQGRYKAVMIETDEQLIHVSRYIHLNPLLAGLTSSIRTDRWSSYSEYVDKHPKTSLCNTFYVLTHFKTPKEYEVFVLNQVDYARRLNVIKHLLLE